MRFKNGLNIRPTLLSVLLAALVCGVPCSPTLAQETGAQKDAPATIEFTSLTHDFGPVFDTRTYTTAFPFANSGDGTLHITEVKASCGCTTLDLPRKIFAPGEASQIDVRFKPKGGGSQSKTITIFTNDPQQPIVVLTIEADVTQFLPTEPRIARFDNVRKGDVEVVQLELKPLDPRAVIERVYITGQSKSTPWFKASIIPDAEGNIGSSRTVQVELLPDAPWGQHFVTLNIIARGRTTADAELVTHTSKVTVSAKVIGTLHANSTMFRVSIVPPGETFTRVVKLVRPDGKSFQVLSATLSGSTVEDMAVKVVPIAEENGGGYSIVLTGTPQQHEQRISGTVMIYTDVPGEEELQLRVGGIARDRP